LLYQAGQGAQADPVLAAQWFRKAADQGHVLSESSLGQAYMTGLGVPRDYRQAVTWLDRAAREGDQWAQYNLGTLYELGLGVPASPQQARKLYVQAAQGPDPDVAGKARDKTIGRATAAANRQDDSDWVIPALIGLVAIAALTSGSNDPASSGSTYGSASTGGSGYSGGSSPPVKAAPHCQQEYVTGSAPVSSKDMSQYNSNRPTQLVCR
jgi:hypothetical protein